MRARIDYVVPVLLAGSLGVLVPAACSAPTIPEGRFACNVADDCPSGFSCAADGLCYRLGAVADVDGGPGDVDGGSGHVDGGPGDVDGGPGCTPSPGTYVETLGTNNSLEDGGTAEGTGITLTTEWQTITGCVDATSDADAFAITIPTGLGARWVDIRVQRTSAPATELRVGTMISTDSYSTLVSTTANDAYAQPRPADEVAFLGPGEHVIRISDAGPVAEPYPYIVSMRLFVCGPVVPGYAEAVDGPGSQGNDVLTVQAPSVDLTESTADMPEPSGITVDGPISQRFSGDFTELLAFHADGYMDRDTFEVEAASGVRALLFHVDFSGTVDALVAAPTLAYPVFANPIQPLPSFAYRVPDYLLASAVVTPGPYWFWLGTKDVASNGYLVTVCGIPE